MLFSCKYGRARQIISSAFIQETGLTATRPPLPTRACYVRATRWLFWLLSAFAVLVLGLQAAATGVFDIRRVFYGVIGTLLWFGLMAASSTASLVLLCIIRKKEWLPLAVGWAGCALLLDRVDPGMAMWWKLSVASFLVLLARLAIFRFQRRPHRFPQEVVRTALLPAIGCLPVGYVLFCSGLIRSEAHDLKAMLIDIALGGQSFQICHWVRSSPSLALVLFYAYQLVPLGLFGLFWLGYRKGRMGAEVIFHFCLASFIGAVFYGLVPIVGPIYTFANYAQHLPRVDLILLNLNQTLLLPPSYPRNCMPSLHLTWALLFCLHARRHGRWVQGAAVLFALVTVLTTLGLGFHYAVDLIPSFPFALLIYGVVPDRRWRPDRTMLIQLALFLFWDFSPLFLAASMYQFPWVTRFLAMGTIAAFFIVQGRFRTCSEISKAKAVPLPLQAMSSHP